MTDFDGFLSVDFEDYLHASNISEGLSPSKYKQLESRLAISTELLLNFLQTRNLKITFFILAEIAKQNSKIISQIADAGHEIASHGFEHKSIYQHTSASFLKDVSDSKKILEDISSKNVLGYRAPNFSITKKTPWAHDCLIEAGYTYDSSIYPTLHPRYSNLGMPRTAYNYSNSKGRILEIPMTTLKLVGNLTLPISGGAYFRIIPSFFLERALARARSLGYYLNIYLHPWELDTQQPRLKLNSWQKSFRHYYGLQSFNAKLAYLIKTYKLTSFESSLDKIKSKIDN